MAGCKATDGYIVIAYQYKQYKAHRIAWYIKTGEIPDFQIDHKDLDKSNNSWSNLRKATPILNNANKIVQKNSLTGIKGVGYRSDINKWSARIGYQNKVIWLGYHSTQEGAENAYKEKAKELFGDFAHF